MCRASQSQRAGADQWSKSRRRVSDEWQRITATGRQRHLTSPIDESGRSSIIVRHNDLQLRNSLCNASFRYSSCNWRLTSPVKVVCVYQSSTNRDRQWAPSDSSLYFSDSDSHDSDFNIFCHFLFFFIYWGNIAYFISSGSCECKFVQ